MPRIANIAVITQKTAPTCRAKHAGMADYAARHAPHWNLVFINAGSPSAEDLDARRFAGIILTSAYPDIIARHTHRTTPLVCIAGSRMAISAQTKCPVIQSDNDAIARMALEHLHSRGLTQFAFYNIRLPSSKIEQGWLIERRESFMRHALKHGSAGALVPGMPDVCVQTDDTLPATVRWLRKLPKPIGIMAANDEQGRVLLDACNMLKLEVPRAVAVIGVDNDEHFCGIQKPHLTSVIQKFRLAGYEAARLLDLQIRGKPTPKLIHMPPQGIAIRDSTDRLAVDNPVLRKAIKFAGRYYARDIASTDAAAAAGVSRATLDNLARRLLGQTIHAVIVEKRLRRAEDLLARTSLPIKQVAAQSGFASTQYLTNVFKRRVGVTPGNYRRQAMRPA